MVDSTVQAIPAKSREQMAFYAAGEISAITRMLRDQKETSDFELLLNGALIRVEALSSVLLSLNGGDDGRLWGEMHEVVFGEMLGVAHG